MYHKKWKHYRKEESDPLSTLIRFIQWAYYQGGVGFVLLIFGIILISGYALFAFYQRGNAIVLTLGIVFFATGVGLSFARKKEKEPIQNVTQGDQNQKGENS